MLLVFQGPPPAKVLARLGRVFLHQDALGIQRLGDLAAGLKLQHHFENAFDNLGFRRIHNVTPVNDVEPQLRLAADVFALAGRRQFLVPLSAFELVRPLFKKTSLGSKSNVYHQGPVALKTKMTRYYSRRI